MLELYSITNDPDLARRLWDLPGHLVMVDLERASKRARQAGRDTFVSTHTMRDAACLAGLRDRGPLMVRVDPVAAGGMTQIRHTEDLGIERVMLPMFSTRDEVLLAAGALKGGTELVLLAETAAAVDGLDKILAGLPSHVTRVHIGLNDLTLDRGGRFLFEPVAAGEMASLGRVVHRHRRAFGFGGVGAAGTGIIAPRRLLGEHVRCGSSAVILSRSFHAAPGSLTAKVAALRQLEAEWRQADPAALEDNRVQLARDVALWLACDGTADVSA